MLLLLFRPPVCLLCRNIEDKTNRNTLQKSDDRTQHNTGKFSFLGPSKDSPYILDDILISPLDLSSTSFRSHRHTCLTSLTKTNIISETGLRRTRRRRVEKREIRKEKEKKKKKKKKEKVKQTKSKAQKEGQCRK